MIVYQADTKWPLFCCINVVEWDKSIANNVYYVCLYLYDIDIIISDGQNVGFSNLEVSMFKDIMETIQQYPERLLRCFVIKPNWSFSALLTTVTPFLDPVTKSKIVTIKDVNDLFQYVDPQHVQKEFGGLSDYDLAKDMSSFAN